MPDLSDRSITAWLAKLPEDVRSALAVEGEVASEGSGGLSAALGGVTPFDVPDLVRVHAGDVRSFGRARRVRLMAWMANSAPEPAPVFARLTDGRSVADGGEGEGSGGASEVGVLFLEDIRALAKALGPRLARLMASAPTMEAVIQSAFTLESDVDFRQGGMR
jgi:hypothetical protein